LVEWKGKSHDREFTIYHNPNHPDYQHCGGLFSVTLKTKELIHTAKGWADDRLEVVVSAVVEWLKLTQMLYTPTDTPTITPTDCPFQFAANKPAPPVSAIRRIGLAIAGLFTSKPKPPCQPGFCEPGCTGSCLVELYGAELLTAAEILARVTGRKDIGRMGVASALADLFPDAVDRTDG
jgi:hypothetical protein